MADIGASVLAKLRNKAKETGRSNQLCMQLFCQEEFLRRLEKSKYADNFVLKGGLFLYTITEFDSRVTVDVDFMLRKIPNTPEMLREVIGEIIEADTTNDFITFEIKDISPISVNKQYPGIHVDIVARIKNTRTPFGIDFGIGDIIVPGATKRKLPGLDFCDVHRLFAILPRGEGDLYLKYCPICADDDRRQYGEAYWHRVHQIRNMQICTKHNCRLVNSAVVAKSEQTFHLPSARLNLM